MDAVNAGDYRLQLNHYYDRTDDPEQIFYRSDHFNYAAQGIPIIFFFDGVHRDYHRPGDEPQKIDYHKMQEVARTVYAIGWRLANQAAVPKINAALPAPLVKAMTWARQQHTADAARFHPPPPRFH
jgi:Zn-dependent M28 family amino/carboxypeptidase